MKKHLFHAAGVIDGEAVRSAPGALLMEGRTVLAAGSPQDVGEVEVKDATLTRLPGAVLMPALVNAHTHLDLSHVGPRAYTGSFASWVDMVRSERLVEPDEIARSVLRGVELSIAGGTAAVGDIAGVGSIRAYEVLRDSSPLRGVSYIEIFGIAGNREEAAAARIRDMGFDCVHHAEAMQQEARIRLGVQPHAPYSCGRRVYEAAVASGLPVATHLAETREEIEFTTSGRGPLADLLRHLGVWDESIRPAGAHPVDALADILERAPITAAHLNYIDDAHLDLLAATDTSVAYCPRASEYFGHPDHRYREMLERGINVALGTDSIICLDTPDRLSVLDDVRLLYRRDGVDPQMLLRMATVNGAKALGLAADLFSFSRGGTAGVIAVDAGDSARPLDGFLRGSEPPRWIIGPEHR